MKKHDMIIEQILDGSVIPTFVIDINHIITHWNRACERQTGLSASEAIGTRKQGLAYYRKERPVLADFIVDGLSREAIVRHYNSGIQDSILLEGGFEVENFFPDLEDKGKWLFFTAAPLKDSQGTIIGAIQTTQDITSRKRIEESLKRKQEELERKVEKRTVELTRINVRLKQEIVQRKDTEKALRLSENKFRTISDYTYNWEYWIDQKGNYVYVSPSFEQITGYTVEEFIGNSELFFVMTHPDDRVELLHHLNEEMTSEKVCHMDFRITTKSGEARWIAHSCQPVYDVKGDFQGRRASNRDITKRKQLEAILRKEREELEIRVKERTENLSSVYDRLQVEMEARQIAYEELKEGEEELRKRKEFTETILDNLPIGLAVNTISDGVVSYMNPKFAQIYDWPEDVPCNFDAFFDHVYHDPEYRIMIKNKVIESIAGRDPSKMIWENLLSTTKSGKQRVVTTRNIPLFDQDMMISTAQDVTEKYKANKDLQFTRFSIDHSDDLLYWIDADANIFDVNETTCSRLGYSRDELLSMKMIDIVSNFGFDEYQKVWQDLKTNKTWRAEASHHCKNGDVIPVEIHLNYIEFNDKGYCCAFARDIALRKELESLVASEDKMSSLGRVAAGIAHEIRNPLSTINVYLSTLKGLLPIEDFDTDTFTSLQEVIEEMDSASHKIETVIKRVMDFSNPSQQQKKKMDINQCVRDAVDLSKVTLRKSEITLEMRLEETLPQCYVDRLSIEQVLLNLITNAADELKESQNKRKIEIYTKESIIRDGDQFISITVSDSGKGIPRKLRDRVFDPFFTTKHYGSGIGLSICHRIISDHNGFLYVRANRWRGAKFVLEIPVTKEAVN